MVTLINILIFFFIFLILYQLFLAYNIKEGLQNQYNDYDTNNPSNALILAQKNAGNISYLQNKLSKVDGLYKEVQDISGNVQQLQSQVTQLMQAQQDYTTQMVGNTPPNITGAVTDDTNDSSIS